MAAHLLQRLPEETPRAFRLRCPAAAKARPDGAATFATEMVAGLLTKTHDNHLVHKTCYGQCRCRCVVVSLCRCRCVCVLSLSLSLLFSLSVSAVCFCARGACVGAGCFFHCSRPVCVSLRALRKLENNADASLKACAQDDITSNGRLPCRKCDPGSKFRFPNRGCC